VELFILTQAAPADVVVLIGLSLAHTKCCNHEAVGKLKIPRESKDEKVAGSMSTLAAMQKS
jgi:hypothetical protein